MMTRRGLGTLALISALGGLLCGCGTSLATNGSDRPLPTPPAPVSVHITSSAQVENGLPLSRYFVSDTDEQAYFQAVNIAQTACAKAFGVTFTGPTTQQPALLLMITQRRYGAVNQAEVARFGYELPPNPFADQTDSKSGSNAWDPTPHEYTVMNASDSSGNPVRTDPSTGKALPKGGCAGDGFRRVDGTTQSPVLNSQVKNLMNDAYSRLLSDHRFQQAELQWSRCMSRNGQPGLKHRWDAADSVESADAASKQRMASLDLKCALETKYLDKAFAIDSAYQNQLIQSNEGQLQGILDQHRQVMARVHSILKNGS